MKSKADEIMDAWVECRKAWGERDAYLAAVRGTFSVLESRGQAPDDNAPLEVTVRRVLDHLDAVTAQRDALNARVELLEAQARAHEITEAEYTFLKLGVERAENALMEIGECSCIIGNDVERVVHMLKCALLEKENAQEELTALKQRVVDAERVDRYFPTRTPGPQRMTFALVRLEDGE